jgi:signal transduction histidine kinase/HAMP domain-containing protein
MRRLNLSLVLVVFNLGVVAVAITGVGVAGVTLLHGSGRRQALADARGAGAGAMRLLAEDGGRLAMTARLLAAHPSLIRLARASQVDSLHAFLDEFCLTSGAAACAVAEPGRPAVIGGDAARIGRAIETEPAEPGWSLSAPPDADAVMLLANAPVPRLPQVRAWVGIALDDEYAARLARRIDAPQVAILTPQMAASRGAEPSIGLRLRALEGGGAQAERLGRSGRVASVTPLTASSGSVAGLLEVSLGEAKPRAAPGPVIVTLVVLALAIGGLATGFSLLLARSIARPVEELTAAATRIGGGDFASPVPRHAGMEIAALAGAMDDMRERTQRLTNELRRRQAEAEAVLAGITEGVFAVGRARRIRYMNPQAAALLGVDAAAALGDFCGDVLRPQGPGGVRPCEESCPILHARFRGSARATEHLLLRDGSRRTVLITSSPAGPEGEDGVGVQFQVIRDETEVETTRRLRDGVLANISHEFRTPLSAQLASLELLRDRLPDLGPLELRELVLAIERGTLRLTRLVDNLLESTRIEAGEDSVRRQPVALDGVIEEAVELMAPLIEQRHQTLQVQLPFPLPAITGDAPRLTQVFVNLLANANKFAPAESLIRVGGAVSEREVRLWVEDQGPGLPDGAGEAIFQRFTRSTGDEPEASGMGLGLFIVKSIVDRHGGRVEAESGPGGTRVVIVLDRAEQDRGMKA